MVGAVRGRGGVGWESVFSLPAIESEQRAAGRIEPVPERRAGGDCQADRLSGAAGFVFGDAAHRRE